MSWSKCGNDSKGRPIGYAVEATCDHPDCAKVIDRGLAYACGGMHGNDDVGCEMYFCEDHLVHFVDGPGKTVSVCEGCWNALLGSGEWRVNPENGCLVRIEAGQPGLPFDLEYYGTHGHIRVEDAQRFHGVLMRKSGITDPDLIVANWNQRDASAPWGSGIAGAYVNELTGIVEAFMKDRIRTAQENAGASKAEGES